MRHHNVNRKFGRETDQRQALLRSLAEGLVLRGKMKTTLARAKEVRPFIEKLITKGRTGTVTARRDVTAALGTTGAKHLLNEVAPKFKTRAGGYTRITKIAPRKGDASPMAIIEFVA